MSLVSGILALWDLLVDWKETSDGYIFNVYLPGLKKEEVKIEVDGQTLQISGGKFLRRLRLPENAKAEEVKAAMDNGVLTVTVLKQPEPKTKVLIQHLHEKLNLCEVLIQHLLEKLNLSEVLIQHLLKKLDLSEAKLKDSQYHLTAWQADPTCQSPYAPQSPFHPNSDHSNPTSAKLKDSQYHLTAWQADPAYQSPYAPQSPFHPNSDHSNPTSNTHGLDIVPQPAYAKGRMPASPPHSHNVGGDWDPSAGKYQHVGISSDLYHGAGHDHLRQPTYSHSSNETYEHQAHAVSPALAPNDLHSVLPSDEEPTMHVPMNDPFSDSEFEDAPGIRAMKEKDPTQRDGRSLHLPTLQEEPNSSNSEEDGPPPAIENLQIVGDAVPGSKLQACGFSINGTTLCVFQWVRHLQDETMVYIEGATQPHYTVTADDVDARIAIECVPMDDRHRKGELVKVFANNQSKIVCDPSMQEQIETYFLAGHAVFDVQLSVGTVDIWEPAVLTLKRSNYEIKGNRQRRVVVGEKYTSELSIVIPYGHQAQFVLTSSAGVSIRLSSSKDNLKMRDTIVLTMRLFKKQTLEKRKGKKKFIFLPK